MTQKQFIAVILATAPLLGFLWGFAEGTLFFIVPDVLISLVALFSLRRFLLCTAAALLGSILAGCTIYYATVHFPEITSSLLHGVPFMPATMFAMVQLEYEQQGVWALLNGPVTGTPYKIYASLAPAYVPVQAFLAVSIPVRLGRFALIGGLSYAIGHLARRHGQRLTEKLLTAHAVIWSVFYVFYWLRVSAM
jgi:membrane protein YqaA with SNARE-associated domain